MAEQKTNRKALKTRRLIRNALAELLTKKELKDITVQEIADIADISRTTFYNYYYDVYDIYEQLEQTVLIELGEMITEHGPKTTFEVYSVVFKYIKENPDVFKMIFSPNGKHTLYMKLKKMVEGINQKLWAESFGVKLNDKRLLYSIRYHSNGTLAIVADWVLNDFDQPEEFVIETLGDLDKNTQNYLISQIGSKTSENRLYKCCGDRP